MQFLRCATSSWINVVAWLISSSIFMAVEGEKKEERKEKRSNRISEPEENLISQSILREPWQ